MIKCFCDRYVCVESQQLDDDDLIGNRPRFRRGSFRALRESRAAGMSRRDFANGALLVEGPLRTCDSARAWKLDFAPADATQTQPQRNHILLLNIVHFTCMTLSLSSMVLQESL